MVSNGSRSAAPDTARPALLWGIALVAAAHAGYLALLLTCDLLRVSPLGFVARFTPGSMVVADVRPGSAEAAADLRTGDRIVSANGQTIQGRMDWQRVRVNIDPAVPLELQVERAGQSATIRIPLQVYASLPGPRPAVIAFRLAQVITLGLAILVAVRRRSQASALLGALLLASIATLSMVLPMRLAVFWRSLPPAIGALLWLPMAVSSAVGPLLFAFFATFPRRTVPGRGFALALAPAADILHVGWTTVYRQPVQQKLRVGAMASSGGARLVVHVRF